MKKHLIILAFALLMFGMVGMAQANTIIFQDDFNTENSGNGALNYNGFTNWNVTDGTVDLIGNGYYDFYPGNGLYVDLDGSTWDAGILTTKTTFNFLSGVQYSIEFMLGGNQRNYPDDVVTVNVSVGSNQYTLSSADPLALFTINFMNYAPGTISFSNAGADNVGAILDNVKLSQVQVPEPTTMLLLGLGLIGLAGIRRKI